MKIFSLQSKTSLVIWSVVLGFAPLLFIFLATSTSCRSLPCVGREGFPLVFKIVDFRRIPEQLMGVNNSQFFVSYLIIDFLFWILLAFLILFIARHFRKKNGQMTSKQN